MEHGWSPGQRETGATTQKSRGAGHPVQRYVKLHTSNLRTLAGLMGSVRQLRNLLRFDDLSPLSAKLQSLRKKFSGSGSRNLLGRRRETGDKGSKPQASSSETQATSRKLQVASIKCQAPSSESLASSAKIFYPFFMPFVFDFESGGIPEPVPLKLVS